MTSDPSANAIAMGAGTFTGISVPGDSIFDNIFDWITNSINSILSGASDAVVKIINAVGDNIVKVIAASGAAVTPIVQIISDTVVTVSSNVTTLGLSVTSLGDKLFNLYIPNIISKVGTSTDDILGHISTLSDKLTDNVKSVISQVATSAVTITTSIGDLADHLAADVISISSSVSKDITDTVSSISSTVVSTFSAISSQVESNLDWFANFLETGIPAILKAGVDGIMGALLDFTTWVPKIFDSISSWFGRDIPGQSPWWHTLMSNIFGWIRDFFFNDIVPFIKDAGEVIATGVQTAFHWIGNMFHTILDDFTSAITSFGGMLGRVDLTVAPTSAMSFLKVGAVALVGLAGMTVAGELLHPLKNMGLGNIAAMIYDITNYKALTGAFVGALAAAAIAIPLGYYYRDIFRPIIPDTGAAVEMYLEGEIDNAMYVRIMGYHGYGDEWFDKLANIGYRAMSPYQLKTAATDGSFNEDIFKRELIHARFRPETRDMLMDSFRKAAATQVKSTSVSAATNRFKNGWTDQSQFTSELKLLQVGDDNIPMYVVMTKLDYMTSYLTDLETAYVDAVRSGQLSLEDFRQSLLAIGMVPERVEGKVLIERLRIKPSAAPGVIAPPKAVYATESGKLQADTIRRQRRLGMITTEEETAALIGLGMPTDLASAYASNDDVLTAESSIPPAGALVPKYETTAGKLQVDTIRRQRRAGTLSHDQETAQLGALSMPADLAESYASNDDLRLKASATISAG